MGFLEIFIASIFGIIAAIFGPMILLVLVALERGEAFEITFFSYHGRVSL